MSLNSFTLNSVALNAGLDDDSPITGEGELVAIEQIVGLMSDGSEQIIAIEQVVSGAGEGELIAIEQEVADVNAGELIAIEQTIVIMSDGLEQLMAIEQTVELYSIGSGQLIAIEQTVQALSVGELIKIEQRVQSPSELLGLDRRGWEAFVTLDGLAIECLHANIRVTRSENGASLMELTTIPQPGLQDIDSLAGKNIICDIQTVDGLFRIFTGKVDVPQVDLIEKKITLSCTDNRVELINSTMAGVVSTIGYWSSVIFQPPKNVAEELEQRLSTVPIAVDFDAYGNYSITSKQAKSIADFVLTGIPPDGVYYRDPSVEYTSRANITNRVSIDFQYRFARLHHMQKHFSWRSPIADNFCLFLQQGYTHASRTMIEQAALTAGWPVRGNISYTPIHPSGWYCGGIGWSTASTQGTTVPVLDSAGNPLIDASGNPVTETRITRYTDYGPTFADGAEWDATTRWVQTVVENYTLIVSAPQSIAQYGVVNAYSQYASEDTTDTASWEDYQTYNNPYNQITNNYFIDTATSRSDLNTAIITAINIAKTMILNLHRDTRVNVSRFIWPQLDLRHTVEINATITNGGALRARGKVFSIIHNLNTSTGEGVTNIALALSRAQGTQVDSGISVPGIATDTVDYGPSTIVLGNHYGEDPAGHPEWHGRIGNKVVPNPPLFPIMTTFAEQFIVDTGDIPDALRLDKDKATSANYNVSIPNDLLEITF